MPTFVLSQANLSLLKQGKVKSVRFEALTAICRELDCQPGDIPDNRRDSGFGPERLASGRPSGQVD
ncbi:MAG: helix-turn-helix domain-containing protein [Wenzhouxiangellaceae bacterium]|nr:helix-turn-helix domain-containing protein [Wenzhouxiangellaceae bacterium]